MPNLQFGKCGQIFDNAGALKPHMKSCEQAVKSGSMWKYITKRAQKKPAIEMKPKSCKEPKQSKLTGLARPHIAQIKPSSTLQKKPEPKQHRQPRPPRLPRSKPVSSLSQFVAPSAITDPKCGISLNFEGKKFRGSFRRNSYVEF